MTTLRTANKRRARSHRRNVIAAAYLEDLDRVTRLHASGRMDKRQRSGFVLRLARRDKLRKKERVR